MDEFYSDLYDTEGRLRDKYQFELKLDYTPTEKKEQNKYTQEFYFFIPSSLQINSATYSKSDFYRDLTGMVRLKTPELNLKKTLSKKSTSPLFNIEQVIDKNITPSRLASIEDELKLYANILRSHIRNRTKGCFESIRKVSNRKEKKEVNKRIDAFIHDIQESLDDFYQFFERFKGVCKEPLLLRYLQYVDEFITIIVEYYLTGILIEIQDIKLSCNPSLVNLVDQQYMRRVNQAYTSAHKKHKGEEARETFVYRKGILKKFVLKSLLLSTDRFQTQHRFQTLIAPISAAIAMLLYLILFIWQGNIFMVNSMPFVFLTVLIYVLKDRLKDVIKTLFFRYLNKQIPDYTTQMQKDTEVVGHVTELFRFINPKRIPKKIYEKRNVEFHTELEQAKRLEQIIYYKRKVSLYSNLLKKKHRRHKLNDIVRFDISQFLNKASNSYQDHSYLDHESRKLVQVRSPKVYHLNLIVKSSFLDQKQQPQEEYRMLRLILDKDGIKRVEKINGNHKEKTL